MSDIKTRTRQLPPSLRPERMTRMPLGCRFGWHHWLWGELSPGRIFQNKTCMRCGRTKQAHV